MRGGCAENDSTEGRVPTSLLLNEGRCTADLMLTCSPGGSRFPGCVEGRRASPLYLHSRRAAAENPERGDGCTEECGEARAPNSLLNVGRCTAYFMLTNPEEVGTR